MMFANNGHLKTTSYLSQGKVTGIQPPAHHVGGSHLMDEHASERDRSNSATRLR